MFGGADLGSVYANVDLKTGALATGITKAQAMMSGLDAKMTAQAASMSGAGARIGHAFVGAAKLIGVGVIGVGIASVKMAADFDSSMHKAWSVTDATKQEMQAWSKEVLNMSTKIPVSAKEIADALYWIKSDMPTATDAEQFKTLEIGARGAVGGMAELSDAVEALITVQNAYNDMRPDHYMDLMNWAVQRGSITLQDFVANMGKATGTAAMTNVPFTELAASVATLTRKGIPADTAFMALNQTMMAFLKNTDEAAIVAQKYGIDMSLTGLRAKGLAGSLLEIAEKVPDEELANLFPNIRALKAVFPLAGTASAEFAEDLRLAGEASGTSAGMFDKAMDNISLKLKLMIQKIQKPLIELGLKMFPTLEKAIASVTRIIEGKNEVFNVYVNTLKDLATAVWNVGGAIAKVKPLVYGLGVSIAAIKLANIVTGLKGLAGISAVFGVISAKMAGGLGIGATSLGMFGSALADLALPLSIVAFAIGSIVVPTYLQSKALDRARESQQKFNKELGDSAEKVRPMVENLGNLRAELSKMTPGSAEYIAKLAEINSLQNQIAAAYPGLIAYVDKEGQAHLRSADAMEKELAMRAKLAGTPTTLPGQAGSLEILYGKQKNYSKALNDYSNVMTSIRANLNKMGASTSQVSIVMDAFALGNKQGKESLSALETQLKSTAIEVGPITEKQKRFAEGSDGLGTALRKVDDLQKKTGMSAYELMGALQDEASQIDQAKQSMIASANQAGQALAKMPDVIIATYRAKNPQLQEAGVQAFAAYIAGVMQNQGISAEAAGNLAQQMFNTGTFVATGNKAVDAALKSMADKLQAAKYLQQLVDVMNVFGEKPKEAKVEVSDGGTAKATVKSLDRVEAKANDLARVRPNVKVSGGDQPASDRLDSFVQRAKDLNGQTLASVNILAKILTTSTPREWEHADEAGRYLASEIAAGGNAAGVSINVGVSAGGGATDTVNNLQSAWEKMLTTVSGIDLRTWGEQNLQYLNKSFNEASDAIYSVTLSYSGMNEEMSRAAQTNFANLNVQLAGANANLNEMDAALQASDASIASWQHQIDQNNASIARYQHDNELAGRAIAGFNKEIEASDKTIEGYNKSIEESNKRLSEYQAAIDRFSNIKITGEAAADEKSFRTTQAINKLKIGILRAEKDHNIELAAKLTLQSEELQKQQEIDSLVASTTYDPQRRQIEAALDPLHGQSETIQNILGGIKSNQSAIATETDMQVGLNSKIEEQRVIQVGINAQIEQQRVIQEGLNAQIEQQRVIQEGVNAKIAEQQALIDANNAQMDILNDQNYELEQTITRERDRVYDLRLEYDECVKNVKNLETAINEMGANAVARWNEITAAIDRANSAAGGSAASYQRGGPVGPGGGTVEYGEFVLSKPMLKAMGGMPRMSPVNVNYSGGDTVVHSHTYLNGREIAHDVSREIGRNASAYSRSGGRY